MKQLPSQQMDSEAELVTTLTQWLTEGGYRVKHEVANMGQSADVVATKGRWVTVFEAKLADWRKALEQCLAHEAVADFICIAIATAKVKDDLREAVESRGYGLVHYCSREQRLAWICRPPRNRRIWRPQRKLWADTTRRIEHEN